MIRPQSNQKHYDDCFSKDPAFIAMPAEPNEKQVAERARLVRIAREQNAWSTLTVDGQSPTVFTFKPLRGTVYRKLIDKSQRRGGVGRAELGALAFRCALVDVANLGVDHKIKFEIDNDHPDLGPMAHTEIADLLDSDNVEIIAELATEILNRASGASPK